ncbi:MAG TPA: hypothetical protein VFV53_09595, partial [Candidatus Limnocylindrales bacterium]|nr:hypothetical protein [Candidatus Limnocylindrales bacterium]
MHGGTAEDRDDVVIGGDEERSDLEEGLAGVDGGLPRESGSAAQPARSLPAATTGDAGARRRASIDCEIPP